MKRTFTMAFFIAMVGLLIGPGKAFASGDTLVVYAKGQTLDMVMRGDTASNGSRLHHFYKLVSTDTTYLFDATITTNESITVWGVPNATTGKLPCIQPDVLSDNSVPGVLFTINGNNLTGTFKNLYLLGIAINNTVNYGAGQAVQVSGDHVKLVVDNVIFEQWSQFAIGYAGDLDKFFITNCKFRNMTTLPNQYYVGELLRNENYIGAFKTDTIIIRYSTMLCVSGYATAATGGIVNYYDFSHNNIVYTFKNPFFLDRMVNAKFNNNIFYGTFAGGQNKTEFAGWDSFTPNTGPSIITMGPLDSTTAALLLGHASTGAADTSAAKLRKVEVKNNVYFWPKGLTDYWTAWNDTAHVDSIYTPKFMNDATVAMFSNKSKWPGFVESGNQNVDPGFGATIPGVLNSAGGNGNGLLDWFKAVRTGTGTTETYGYNITQVGNAADWVPAWPLPESNDMKYSSTAVKNSATDGLPLGDPYWFTGTLTGVVQHPAASVPNEFSLSAAYPNPFNPSTHFKYTLSTSGIVTLRVYNILGQVVKTVVNQFQTSGEYNVSVDMSTVTSGVYFGVLEQGTSRQIQKMVLMK